MKKPYNAKTCDPHVIVHCKRYQDSIRYNFFYNPVIDFQLGIIRVLTLRQIMRNGLYM